MEHWGLNVEMGRSSIDRVLASLGQSQVAKGYQAGGKLMGNRFAGTASSSFLSVWRARSALSPESSGSGGSTKLFYISIH